MAVETAVETQLRQPVRLPGAAFPSGLHLRQQARTPDRRLSSLLPPVRQRYPPQTLPRVVSSSLLIRRCIDYDFI
jgi:hypothetical protein